LFVEVEDIVLNRTHDKRYHNLQDCEISFIQTALIDWYRLNKRDLPWRDRTVSNVPYRVLVAG
jgi:adenine-specific DNA glycosylase